MIAYCNLHGGTGKPLWEITLGEYTIWFQVCYAVSQSTNYLLMSSSLQGVVGTAFLYPAMTACIRISILLFYRRIFAKADPTSRLFIWVMIALNCAFIVTFEVIPGFICKPLSAGWRNPLTRRQHCRQDEFYYLYNIGLYGSGLGLDIILLLMPVYPVLKLQMPLKRKLGALVMFMLGASYESLFLPRTFQSLTGNRACIAASYKLAIYVTQWGRTGTIDPRCKFKPAQYPTQIKLTDPGWHTQMSRAIPPQWDKYGYTFWIPTHVEPTVAIIGSSLPAMRNHIQTPFKKLTSVISGSKTSRHSSSARSDKASAQSSQSKYIKMQGGSAQTSQNDVELASVRAVSPA